MTLDNTQGINIQTKEWYKSKTMWFNLAVGVAAGMPMALPILQPLLTPVLYLTAMFIVAVVNIVLRSITEQGLK